MSAFAGAVGALFADPNVGRDAVYIVEGGTPVLVRVVARRADAFSDFGDARLWSETTRIEPPPPSAASLDESVITGGSVSKAHGAPGLRVGWLTLRDPDLRARLIGAALRR